MESFGSRLKRERERRGITLDDISVSTKIGTRMLHALEEDHFDQLPGGIFNRGFVRAYAHHLGLDEEEILAEYLEASGDTVPGRIPEAAEPDSLVEVREEEERAGTDGIPWGWFAGIVLIIAIGVATWGAYSRGKRGPAGGAEQPASLPAKISPETAPVPSRAGSSTPAPNVVETSAPPQGMGAKPVDAARSPAPTAFVVRISAREDCWVSVKADGKEIMQDTLFASTERSVQARQQIVIRAGNVAALDLSFNGRKLPPQGAFGEAKTLTFSSSGLQPPPPKPPEPQPAAPPPSLPN
jgi:cytoskeleton protein RodZ